MPSIHHSPFPYARPSSNAAAPFQPSVLGKPRDTNRATPDTNIHEFWLIVNNSPTIPCSVAERRNPLRATELLLSRGSVAPRRTFTALAQNQINRERAREVNEKRQGSRLLYVLIMKRRDAASPSQYCRSVDCETPFLLRRRSDATPCMQEHARKTHIANIFQISLQYRRLLAIYGII